MRAIARPPFLLEPMQDGLTDLRALAAVLARQPVGQVARLVRVGEARDRAARRGAVAVVGCRMRQPKLVDGALHRLAAALFSGHAADGGAAGANLSRAALGGHGDILFSQE